MTYKPYKRPDDSTAERGSTFCQLDKYFCDEDSQENDTATIVSSELDMIL